MRARRRSLVEGRRLSRSQAEGGTDRSMRAVSKSICILGRKRCARVFQKSNLPGRPGTNEGTKPKAEAWDSLGGKFATCSSANDLGCWFACQRLIRPFRAVEWMTISVDAGANGCAPAVSLRVMQVVRALLRPPACQRARAIFSRRLLERDNFS